MADIRETAITWDHDLGKIHVSTSHRPTANKLRKLGLEEQSDQGGGYFGFVFEDAQFNVTIARKRKLSDEVKATLPDRLRQEQQNDLPTLNEKVQNSQTSGKN